MPIQRASSRKCIVGWSTTPADFIVDFKSVLLANFFAAALWAPFWHPPFLFSTCMLDAATVAALRDGIG